MAQELLSATSERLRYAISQLLVFVHDEAKLSAYKADFMMKMTEKGKALIHVLKEELKEEVAVWQELREMIEECNNELPSSTRYPRFPLFPQEGAIPQVQAHVIAFELFLNQKLRLNQLPLEKEAPLFSKSLILWRDVGNKLIPMEAMVQLSSLINETNRLLAEKEAYPLPTTESY